MRCNKWIPGFTGYTGTCMWAHCLQTISVHVCMSLIGRSEQTCVYRCTALMHAFQYELRLGQDKGRNGSVTMKENSTKGTACSQMLAGIKTKESGNRS